MGDELVRIVRRLVEIGLLESRENGYEVRWPTKPLTRRRFRRSQGS